MSDDLIRRLRESGSRSEVELHEDREDAADRIEELEAKLAKAVELADWVDKRRHSPMERVDFYAEKVATALAAFRTTIEELKGSNT